MTRKVSWLAQVGHETIAVELDEQYRLRVFVAERPGGPLLVCTPTEAAMLALALQQAAAAAGPAYAKKRRG